MAAGAVLAAVLAPASLPAAEIPFTGFNYTPGELLDARPPLEIPASERIPPYDIYYQPVLFDETNNSLDMVRIDVTVEPPTASPIVIASGSNFALGSAREINDTIAFSFVDPAFDLRLGGCTDPCTSTFNRLVNAGTWIDSSSSASANDFFVAGLDNLANHGVSIFASSDDGATWSPFSNFTPAAPGGVYDNFHGGKRIALAVDRTSTNRATTRNCLVYETRPTSGSTNLRMNCRVGSTPRFDVLLDTDVPNPSNTFDRTIELRCDMNVNTDGTVELSSRCVYTKRQTNRIRAVRVGDTGSVQGPVDLPAVPSGSTFYNPAIFEIPQRGGVMAITPGADGVGASASEWNYNAGITYVNGPGVDTGPLAADIVQRGPGLQRPEFWTMGRYIANPRFEGVGGGLGLVIAPYPIFFDGFETANVLRWSHHLP
ncbi:MAG: hypothetical protein AB7G12_16160 [Thermoanaerobaculia bacterium]